MASDEPLDIENEPSLLRYLRATNRIAPDETPRTRVLAGGVSNKTVLVERPSGESWVLKQALPKLRTQVDWFSDPSRIRREAEALRWLPKLAWPGSITPLVFEDPSHFVLAMQAVPEPHENFKSMLLEGRAGLDHLAHFGALLARIHSKSVEHRAELEAVFGDRSFFESLRAEPYYAYSAQQVPAAAPFLSELIKRTRSRRLALVHGDYSPKNILVTGGPRWHLVLLDHEVIHWGDPAFDLGFAFTHLLSKAHRGLRDDPKLGSGAAWLVWRNYSGPLGNVPWRDDLEHWAIRHTLACLLARVAGRSPLEYLDAEQRARQREAAVAMMADPPASVEALCGSFMERVK